MTPTQSARMHFPQSHGMPLQAGEVAWMAPRRRPNILGTIVSLLAVVGAGTVCLAVIALVMGAHS